MSSAFAVLVFVALLTALIFFARRAYAHDSSAMENLSKNRRFTSSVTLAFLLMMLSGVGGFFEGMYEPEAAATTTSLGLFVSLTVWLVALNSDPDRKKGRSGTT